MYQPNWMIKLNITRFDVQETDDHALLIVGKNDTEVEHVVCLTHDLDTAHDIAKGLKLRLMQVQYAHHVHELVTKSFKK